MKTEFIEVAPRTGLMIGSTMLVAGLLIVAWKFQRIAEEFDSLRWPSALGVIESSNFYTSTAKTGKKSHTTHHGEFSYRYSVGNTEYAGHRYDAKGSMRTGLEHEAAKVQEQAKSGSALKVFYNPDNPSSSVLKNGISEDTWVRITFSIFFSHCWLCRDFIPMEAIQNRRRFVSKAVACGFLNVELPSRCQFFPSPLARSLRRPGGVGIRM